MDLLRVARRRAACRATPRPDAQAQGHGLRAVTVAVPSGQVLAPPSQPRRTHVGRAASRIRFFMVVSFVDPPGVAPGLTACRAVMRPVARARSAPGVEPGSGAQSHSFRTDRPCTRRSENSDALQPNVLPSPTVGALWTRPESHRLVLRARENRILMHEPMSRRLFGGSYILRRFTSSCCGTCVANKADTGT